MADITSIFGGAFAGVQERRADSPEVQLMNAIESAGMEPPDAISMDGRIHRFRSGTKGKGGHGDKTGWYVAFNDGVPAGRFGCWRAGIEMPWRADIGRQVTQVEQMAIARRMAEAQKARDEEVAKRHEVASSVVEQIWSDCVGADAAHPYLSKKGIKPHGARVTGDGRLVVPLCGDDGVLSSLQYIDESGGKLYHAGGKTGGKYWMTGTMDEGGDLFVAEGFATAATITEETGRPCVIAYSASNIVPVLGSLRDRYGKLQSITIVADNDESGVGWRYAEQAAAKHGAKVVMPPEKGDANDLVAAGGDLLSLLYPATNSDWLVSADDFCLQPAPIRWLMKGWIPGQALVMIHGQSGSGKTFLVLDWCLSIAAGLTERMGFKLRGGRVVYLAGEGHNGLRGRVAAWKERNNVHRLDMFLSKGGCDLNTAEGYLQVQQSLAGLDQSPDIIVVDTLHRFLSGDENSAQDAKTMLDACARLTTEFNATVILVHHTGVSDAAQHRARGSSAWRGALDVEISVAENKKQDCIEVVQRKNKDAELCDDLFVRLERQNITGWFDEDGEQVHSAVVTQADIEPEEKVKNKPSPEAKHKKTIEQAWWYSGAEIVNGNPYISRGSFIDYMVENQGMKFSGASNYAKPSYKNGTISVLLEAGIIAIEAHGWVVTDPALSSSMVLMKGAK